MYVCVLQSVLLAHGCYGMDETFLWLQSLINSTNNNNNNNNNDDDDDNWSQKKV